MLGLLNISEAMSIALHTCVSLAGEQSGYHSARQISEKFNFSPHHFAKVAQQLARAEIIETERGPSGGARLLRAPGKISLLEIHAAVGGAPKCKGCLLKHEICKGSRCALGKMLAEENKRLVSMLGNTTLEDVANSLKASRAKKKTAGEE
jgi:Rrf2 family protein